MGRNSAIRNYKLHPEGQVMDLFGDAYGKRPVVLELLKSPWVKRGSEIPVFDGPRAAKRLEVPIDVSWDAGCRTPSAFILCERIYRVETLLQTWSIEQRWWRPKERVSCRGFRVLARGGVYDLVYDRLGHNWLLVGIVD